MENLNGDATLVVIPALNEIEGVRSIVDTARLLSERPGVFVVVADGGSTDGTLQALTAQGVDVIDTAAQEGRVLGKGDTVVRAVHRAPVFFDRLLLLDADVVIDEPKRWFDLIDAAQAATPFVKASFVRVRESADQVAAELPGGRVTDLVARPILMQEHPELASLSQPLSGQVSIHRSALERLWWYSHYGFEIGMLLSAAAAFGDVPEVSIGRLQHRSRSDIDLAATALDVVDTFQGWRTGQFRPGSRVRRLKAPSAYSSEMNRQSKVGRDSGHPIEERSCL